MTTRGGSAARRPIHSLRSTVGQIARLDAEVTVKSLIARMRTWLCDDSGQDLLEYALLASLISLIAYAAVQTSGQQINALFMSAASMMQNAAQAAGA
jgi:Flp pilus assembly pilin Flp